MPSGGGDPTGVFPRLVKVCGIAGTDGFADARLTKKLSAIVSEAVARSVHGKENDADLWSLDIGVAVRSAGTVNSTVPKSSARRVLVRCLELLTVKAKTPLLERH